MGKITLLSQGNLEGLKKQVCECIDHAQAEGYKRGYTKGKNDGHAQGCNTQSEYDKTKIDEAKQDGYNQGYADGKKEGYDNGFEQGKKQATSELPELANKENEMYNKGLEDASNLLAYADERFIRECFPNESNWNLFDLNAKYGLAVVIKEFKKWQEKNKKAEEINDYNFIVDSLRNMIDDYGEEKVINALSEFGIEVNNV